MPDIFDDEAGRQGANAQVVAGPAGDIFDEVASRLEEPYRRAKPFETFRPGPMLTERAAPAAQPTLALPPPEKPPTLDLAKYPVNVFTGRYVDRPPMRTEEEKRRLGTWPAPAIRPEEVSTGPEGVGLQGDILAPLKRAIGAGAPSGSLAARATGQQGTTGADVRLLAPEELMTPVERARHPILTGAAEFGGGLTSPENLLIMAMTQGLGALRGAAQGARFAIPKTAPEVGALAARLVPRAISGYFSGTMGKQAAVDLPLAPRSPRPRRHGRSTAARNAMGADNADGWPSRRARRRARESRADASQRAGRKTGRPSTRNDCTPRSSSNRAPSH